MWHLTKQEQLVLTVILILLLTGLTVQSYRKAHPAGSPPRLSPR